jgi:hypothetical protein
MMEPTDVAGERVAPAVIVRWPACALCPAAFRAGYVIGCAVTRTVPTVTRRRITPRAVAGAAVPAVLAAAVPVLAWLVYQAAGHGYATRASYTRGPLTAARSRVTAHVTTSASRLRTAHLTSASDGFASRVAHAPREGLPTMAPVSPPRW